MNTPECSNLNKTQRICCLAHQRFSFQKGVVESQIKLYDIGHSVLGTQIISWISAQIIVTEEGKDLV